MKPWKGNINRDVYWVSMETKRCKEHFVQIQYAFLSTCIYL